MYHRVEETERRFGAWLTVLARNTARNRVRNKRPREVALEEQPLTDPQDVERTVLRREQTEQLMTAVKTRLKPSEQILFFCKYYGNTAGLHLRRFPQKQRLNFVAKT